jgi:hypothetical protein
VKSLSSFYLFSNMKLWFCLMVFGILYGAVKF